MYRIFHRLDRRLDSTSGNRIGARESEGASPSAGMVRLGSHSGCDRHCRPWLLLDAPTCVNSKLSLHNSFTNGRFKALGRGIPLAFPTGNGERECLDITFPNHTARIPSK